MTNLKERSTWVVLARERNSCRMRDCANWQEIWQSLNQQEIQAGIEQLKLNYTGAIATGALEETHTNWIALSSPSQRCVPPISAEVLTNSGGIWDGTSSWSLKEMVLRTGLWNLYMKWSNLNDSNDSARLWTFVCLSLALGGVENTLRSSQFLLFSFNQNPSSQSCQTVGREALRRQKWVRIILISTHQSNFTENQPSCWS